MLWGGHTRPLGTLLTFSCSARRMNPNTERPKPQQHLEGQGLVAVLGLWGITSAPIPPPSPAATPRPLKPPPQLWARNSHNHSFHINDPKNHPNSVQDTQPRQDPQNSLNDHPKSPLQTPQMPIKSDRSPSQSPHEPLNPLPAPHGTDQESLEDRNIPSREQLRHFSSDLGTLRGTPQTGRPRPGTGTDTRNPWRTDGLRWTRSASTTTRSWPCLPSPWHHNTQILPNIPWNQPQIHRQIPGKWCCFRYLC